MSNKNKFSKEMINLKQTKNNNDPSVYIDEEEDDDDDNNNNEGELLPSFPYPIGPVLLTRTDNDNISTRSKKNLAIQRWNIIKNDLIINKGNNNTNSNNNNKTSKLSDIVQSVNVKTKSFLGVESNKKVSRSVNNWNERQFKLLNNNSLFGGKLNKNKLAQYIDSIDNSTDPDCASPLLYYKLSDGDKIDIDPKKNVTTIAFNGLKRVMLPGKEEINKTRENIDEPDKGADVIEEANQPGPCDAFSQAFSGKRLPGMGFCGRLFDNNLDPSKQSEYYEVLKTIKQHRPYFTYWITFVQIVICLVSIFAYGLAPIGFSYTLKTSSAVTTNLERRHIEYTVKQNFWIGPEPMDLVHLGAKYAPCMRNDTQVYKAIKEDTDRERETACCIRNDRGGCFQTNKEKCSRMFSKWHKWNTSEFVGPIYHDQVSNITRPRTSGSVCGLDPQFCADSKHKGGWQDDITQWPICESPPTALINIASTNDHQHMYCELIGRPCCIGIQGECLITTLDHCKVMRGYFHSEANLCSQVDCMQDVCGMIDFLNTKNPDQIYRLFTSIFIHAGILQLLISIFFNIFILRDLEKLAGSLRIGIVFVGSGVIGNLGSAIFLPYQAEVGPLGSHFGILACHFIELFHAWEYLENPWLAFFKIFLTLIIFFVIGLLPMIDNFANLFGFISGLLLAAILFPNIDLRGRVRRTIIICVCITITVLLFASLVVLFYIKPIENCEVCKFFSCPFGKRYCLEMDFNITRLKDL